MAGRPETVHPVYHGGAMTLPGTALFACLALLSAASQAQTYAPADDRPGRYVLVPMSVERPPGDGWTAVRRSDTDLVFLRPAEKDRHSLVAIASGKVPVKRARSSAELAANVREELKNEGNEKRFEILKEEVLIEPAGGRKCVRYRQRARDLGARGADGQTQIISLHGLACLHDADEGIVVTASLSERGPAEGGNAALAAEAARFFAGVRQHLPLKHDGWRTPAEQGDANAQVWLARSLLRSNELEEAIAWLDRAAEKGNAEAMTMLGMAYGAGRVVTKSPQEAVKWLRLAADSGYPKAEALLGLTLVTAADVRNEEEGRRWVHKAAADGDPLGQSLLGEFLLSGKAGLGKNEAEAAAWYRKAAAQGDAKAQYMLANLLANGTGVEKDLVQSRFWLELAAAQGHPDARRILDQARRASRPAPAPIPAEGK